MNPGRTPLDSDGFPTLKVLYHAKLWQLEKNSVQRHFLQSELLNIALGTSDAQMGSLKVGTHPNIRELVVTNLTSPGNSAPPGLQTDIAPAVVIVQAPETYEIGIFPCARRQCSCFPARAGNVYHPLKYCFRSKVYAVT